MKVRGSRVEVRGGRGRLGRRRSGGGSIPPGMVLQRVPRRERERHPPLLLQVQEVLRDLSDHLEEPEVDVEVVPRQVEQVVVVSELREPLPDGVVTEADVRVRTPVPPVPPRQ